jgi:dTDP-4-amino-4,6-dideoxygalactose transaminase
VDSVKREKFIQAMGEQNISAYIGYVPLHTSPKGAQIGSCVSERLPVTDQAGNSLVRLPFYNMNKEEVEYVISILKVYFNESKM